MKAMTDVTQQEIGLRLKQVRDAAGINQAELARRVTWSPAVLSRVESGERQLSADELKQVLEAIATPDALQLATVIGREWQELPRPPLDHPDHDALWEAEEVCRDLVKLRNHPDVR